VILAENKALLSQRTRGIPGRAFVFVFVISLFLIGLLTFAIGARFQTLMNRLEVVRSLWPNASQELKVRYDRLAQKLQIEQPDLPLQSDLSKWRLEFESTSQFDRQSVAALQIERQIAMATSNENWNPSDFETPGLSKLLAADQDRKKVQDGILGWLTIQGLRLKLPPIFEPYP
jgi:hypothetical protein